MKIKLLSLGFLVMSSGAIASDPDPIPPEILAGRTCQEHIVQEARMTADDLPRNARGREYSATVVISYKLDGSGKAVEPKVVYSQPARLFERATINLLGRTQFAVGVVESSCYYTRSYSAVRRSGR